MMEQLKNINTIYDLFALCSSYILAQMKSVQYEFGLFDDEKYNDVYDAVDRYCCEKEESGKRVAFEEMRSFAVDYFQTGISIERCFAFVMYIDELVEVEISSRLIGGNGITQYSSLNLQYVDRIRIIPKIRNTFVSRGDIELKMQDQSNYSLFRKKRECACSVLDQQTLNYMIWDEDKISKYPVTICHIDEKSHILKHFADRNRIAFGIVPVTCRKLDEILEIKYEQKTFSVERMREEAEKELTARYLDVLGRSAVQKIDFLIFPEMLMTDKILNELYNEKRRFAPQIVVNGSIWKDFTNKSVVTDGTGGEIFSYCKKTAYKYRKESEGYREYLDTQKNKHYSIMEIDGIGRIGVAICKDIINEEIKMFHKYMGTNILLIPSYTESLDLQSAMEEMAQDYNSIVVVANACSARYGKEIIGLVSVPGKKDTERSNITFGYGNEECMNQCEGKCTGKLITVDFSKKEEYEAKIGYVVQEDSF